VQALAIAELRESQGQQSSIQPLFKANRCFVAAAAMRYRPYLQRVRSTAENLAGP
jgi:hypothetical protein